MKKISVIGSGTMGNGIAQTLALYEHDVVLYDINLNNLENANKTISNSLSRMVNKNLISTPIARSVVPISAFYFLLSNNITVLATRDHINIKRRFE